MGWVTVTPGWLVFARLLCVPAGGQHVPDFANYNEVLGLYPCQRCDEWLQSSEVVHEYEAVDVYIIPEQP